MTNLLREIIEERIRYWRDADERALNRWPLPPEEERGAGWRVMELTYILEILLPAREGQPDEDQT